MNLFRKSYDQIIAPLANIKEELGELEDRLIKDSIKIQNTIDNLETSLKNNSEQVSKCQKTYDKITKLLS